MPNTGRRSGACLACKRMKIRCTEEKPACSRCTRVKRVCPGYGPAVDNFRHAAAHLTAPVKITMLTQSPALAPEEWSTRAISFFFWTHTVPAPLEQKSLGFFDFLEEYFQIARPTFLTDALNAAALSSYAHFVPDVPHLSIDALSARGRALKALAVVLRDVKIAKSDDVLVALYLIERSEILGIDNQSKNLLLNHATGLSTILHLRGQSQFESEIGRHMARWINGSLILKDASYGTNLYYESMPEEVFPRISGRRATRAHAALIGLMRRFRAAVMTESNDPQNLEEIRRVGLDAWAWIIDIESWPLEEIEPTSATRTSISVFGTQTTIELNVYKFRCFMDAVALSIILMASFRHQRLMIDCIKNLTAASSHYINEFPTLDEATDMLTDIANRLAGTVPFLFGQLPSLQDQPYPSDYRTTRGSFAGCLYNTSTCILIAGTPELDTYNPTLRQWAMATLLEMSTLYGNKQAQAFHDVYKGIPKNGTRHHFSPWTPKLQLGPTQVTAPP